MNGQGEAAETVLRLSFQGMDYTLKIAGSGAKHLAAFLIACFSGKEKVKGKTRLVNMLKSGKQLKVFSVKESDFKKFAKEAKRYGVLYSALAKKNQKKDGVIDVMVRAEDASKINRIVKRFELSTIATVENQKPKEKNEPTKGETLANDILTPQKEKQDVNPTLAMTEKSPLSEPTSENKNQEQGTNFEKKSVKKELKEIKEQQEKTKLGNKKKKVKNRKKKGKEL